MVFIMRKITPPLRNNQIICWNFCAFRLTFRVCWNFLWKTKGKDCAFCNFDVTLSCKIQRKSSLISLEVLQFWVLLTMIPCVFLHWKRIIKGDSFFLCDSLTLTGCIDIHIYNINKQISEICICNCRMPCFCLMARPLSFLWLCGVLFSCDMDSSVSHFVIIYEKQKINTQILYYKPIKTFTHGKQCYRT